MGGDFKIEEDDLSKFTKEIFFKHPEKLNKFKGWWHKHPIEGWSGMDDATFTRLKDTFKGSIIGLVKQGNGKILCRVDLKNKKTELTVNTLNLIVIDEEINMKKLDKECRRLFKEKVKEYNWKARTSDISLNNDRWWLNTGFDTDKRDWNNNALKIGDKAVHEGRQITYNGWDWTQDGEQNLERRTILFDRIENAIKDEIERWNNITTTSIDECSKKKNCVNCEFNAFCSERRYDIYKSEHQYYMG